MTSAVIRTVRGHWRLNTPRATLKRTKQPVAPVSYSVGTTHPSDISIYTISGRCNGRQYRARRGGPGKNAFVRDL
jgi:hypothetical protein